MAWNKVQFPKTFRKGHILKVPSTRKSAEELVIIVKDVITFRDIDELYEYCQSEEHPAFEFRTRRKPQ